MNDKEMLKRRFLNMPEDKKQRLHDQMTKLFARLEADWKSKPENAGKTVPYKKLWDDFNSQKNEGEQSVPGYPPQGVGSPEP